MRDEAAFVEFAQAASARLRRTAYLMCGDWDLASDHVQEGLIRVYVAWPRLTRSGGEYAYARRAVVSALIDHARRRSSTEVVSEVTVERSSEQDVAEDVSARAALMTALTALPPRQRACVVLRYFEDLSVAQVAEALGCSEGTVKSQTSRALASLRSVFDGSPLGGLVTEGASSW
ncbi:SigE family RNA polymerase sigma factor [Nocardioides iriomotensis]|uniref:SigE family RNA polymerase sigma factor n=1 Tax=Nocardioides iriomotensis TaxID=715784 RepID=A0A4Q5JA14_9ACTN|nr:SigE family RNA polymerase sigma factor [Nocardioides iriomotensis]RYU15560.1 SigE family RNA polymerase sigma factor [Nocardioides iriomotensis]